MTAPGLLPEHDIFIQLMKLKNTLRWMQGEDLITHLGLEYSDWRPSRSSNLSVTRSFRETFANMTAPRKYQEAALGRDTKRILVIGGTQFIGRLLVEKLSGSRP